MKTLADISEAMKDIDFCMLVSRAEATMTPQLVSEMRSRLPVGGVPRPVGAER